MSEVTHEWTSRIFVGETPFFETAHLQVEARLPGSPPQWPKLIRASVGVARQLSASLGAVRILENAAAHISDLPAANPWLAWVEALARAAGTPDWPCRAEQGDEGRIRLRLGFPYPVTAARWARTALDLLWMANALRDRKRLRVAKAVWGKRFRDLSPDLPQGPVMALHYALHEQKLLWAGTADGCTLVGSGSRQHAVRRAIGRADAQAAGIAAVAPQIPLFTVTGSVGKTTTVRLLSQLLEPSGLRQALAASDGAWAAGQRIGEGDCIDGLWAARLLSRTDVDVALLEVGCGGILGYGIPYRQSDVAILLNIGDNHLGRKGTETIEQLTEVKALSVARGRLHLINRDDSYCRLVGERLPASTCIWFSRSLPPAELEALSRNCGGVLGVLRDARGGPVALAVWRDGIMVETLSLEGVAPYHGLLGEKTLEELLAAVGATVFGPVKIASLGARLQELRLDAENHPFRMSLHPNGNCLFVLDKGSEDALELLPTTLGTLKAQHGLKRSIVLFTLSPAYEENAHRTTCAHFHPLFEELVSYERPHAYQLRSALPTFREGDVSRLHLKILGELNEKAGTSKPCTAPGSWNDAEAWLRKRLEEVSEPTLILINQPSTADTELNRRILDFVGSPLLNPHSPMEAARPMSYQRSR